MGCIQSICKIFYQKNQQKKNYEVFTNETICYSNRLHRDAKESYNSDYYEDKTCAI